MIMFMPQGMWAAELLSPAQTGLKRPVSDGHRGCLLSGGGQLAHGQLCTRVGHYRGHHHCLPPDNVFVAVLILSWVRK